MGSPTQKLKSESNNKNQSNSLPKMSSIKSLDSNNFDDITPSTVKSEPSDTPKTVGKSDVLSSYEFVNSLHKQQVDNSFGLSSVPNNETAGSDHENPFLVLSKDTFLEHHSSIVQCR